MAAGRIVIVGAGITGVSAAQTLRGQGYDGDLVVFGDEPGLPYRRTMVSKELLAGGSAERALLKWDAADLRPGRAVAAIDPAARTVTTDRGERLGYDGLLLATGGRPHELPMAPEGVHYVRTMRDAAKLRAALDVSSSVLVIGAGLIGCEVAAAAARSHRVTVLEAGARVMEKIVPQQVSTMLADLHADNGVELHTGVRLESIERLGPGFTAIAADGRSWSADVVVIAVGMAPNSELAVAAGLAVSDGVEVDELCRTSAPGIFAAGDVARLPNPVLGGTHRVEHWNHAQAHGEAAALAMLGGVEPYRDVPWCWSNQYGKNLQMAGWPGAAAQWTVDGSVDGRDFTALGDRDGSLVAAISLGRPREVRAAREQIGAVGARL